MADPPPERPRPSPGGSQGLPRLALVASILAATALVGGWLYAASLQAPGVDWSQQSMTVLAAQTTPHRWAMALALTVTGAAHVITAWSLPRLRRPGRLLLTAAGLATAGLAFAPDPSLSTGRWVHTVLAGIALAAGSLWLWWAGRAIPMRATAIGFLALAATLPLTAGSTAFGAHERAVTTLLILAPVSCAAWRWWQAGHRIGNRSVRVVMGVAALTLGCIMGGVSATSIVPASAHTEHYSATFSLSPDPRDISDLTARTIFGDIQVRFAGFAPGVRATPQVRASIAEVLARPGISIRSLQPDPAELEQALRTAGTELAWRFVAGAGAVCLLVVGVAIALRRERTTRAVARTLATGLAALVLGSAGTVLAGILTYRHGQVQDFTSTGVLGTIQRNSALLSDVEARSSQVTPYLRNLIALSSALQDRYAPTTLDSPVALRLLLVSDLHDGNQFALMRSIIDEEDVDAVIDSGDLLDFGTVQEGETAGMFQGIASLPVPYIFVRGNHDAAFAGDEEVLERLARIPNVVLLQPSAQQYTDVLLNGVRIRGFNDPRWFGDDGIRTAQKQQPAVAAFRDAFAGQQEPDLLVSHEPSAVIGLKAGVLVNGHMHTPDLEGNRIQVGTFTGGGPLTHFVPAEDGAELVGQPSAFDILTFGDTCRVTSLTRYRFRDVLEGRPAYDSVSLVNGARIDRREPDPGRTCARTGTLVKLPVPAVAAVGPINP